MRLSQLPIGSFYLFKMLSSACSLSLSLVILALLTVSASDVLDLGPPTNPPFFLYCFYFICFQAVEMLTRTARGALNVTNSATGQGNVLPPGIAHEALIAEPLSPQDIRNQQFSDQIVFAICPVCRRGYSRPS